MFGDTLNLRRLRLFLELAKVGHVGRTAAQLKIEQTSLTRSLADLERDVGYRLFDRQPKGMALTKAGSIFEDFAATILAQLDGFKILNETHEIRKQGLRDVIRVGLSSFFAPTIMPSALSVLTSCIPDIQILFIEGDDSTLCDATARGELDACITCDTSRSTGLISKLLLSQELIYIAPAKWAGDDLVSRQTFKQIASRPLILPSKKSGLRRAVSKEMFRQKIASSQVIETSSLATTKALIAFGTGATISIGQLYRAEVLSGRVQVCEIVQPKATIGIYMSVSDQNALYANSSIHSCLEEVAKEAFGVT